MIEEKLAILAQEPLQVVNEDHAVLQRDGALDKVSQSGKDVAKIDNDKVPPAIWSH